MKFLTQACKKFKKMKAQVQPDFCQAAKHDLLNHCSELKKASETTTNATATTTTSTPTTEKITKRLQQIEQH